MQLTTRSRYGLRMLLDIALHGEDGPVRIQDIAKRRNISVKYLEQLIRALKKAGFITSKRGPKGGHVLAGADGQVYGVDHGVSLHAEDKLRTVLWGWAGKPIDDDVLGAVAALRDALRDGLAATLAPHLTRPEIAALQARVVELLDNPIMPSPDRHRPIPWPAF